MGTAMAAVRHALRRQARQSALACRTATPALLVLTPIAAAIRAIVAEVTDHGVPLGEAFVATGLGLISFIVGHEVGVAMMRGKLRLWLVLRSLAVFVSACVAMVALAAHVSGVGATQHIRTESNIVTGAAGIPIVTLISVVVKPIAILLRPDQRCGARLRRTMRVLKATPVTVAVMAPAFTVVVFVFMTVFTQLTPAEEVLVMGVSMPLLQAFCMTVSAHMAGRIESQFHRRKVRHTFNTESAAAAQAAGKVHPSECHGEDKSKAIGVTPLDKHSEADDLEEASNDDAQGANSGGDRSGKRTRLSLMMVLTAEIFYSTGAFTTLALTESDGALFLSLVLMLSIEVVQVAVHVKARVVVSHVASNSSMSRIASKSNITAETLLGNNDCILQWLLHQELGEKIGLLLALGFLAVDKTLGRDVPAVNAVSMTRLAYRGLAMVLMELLSDIGKDVVSQAIGLIPASASTEAGSMVARVSLPPVAVAFVFSQSVQAGLLVQIGLALGTP